MLEAKHYKAMVIILSQLDLHITIHSYFLFPSANLSNKNVNSQGINQLMFSLFVFIFIFGYLEK